MPCVIFDLKEILIPTSCIEQFGKDLTKYNIESGSNSTFRSFYAGITSIFAKNFGNGWAYRFANDAYRGALERLVDECSEKYRKLVPEESKRVIRDIKHLGMDVGIITHDIHSLCLGIYDEFDVGLDDVRDNDFTFHEGCVSGIDHDQHGWPRVHDKTNALIDYMLEKRYGIEDVVLVGHGLEEVKMARLVKNRIIVPEKGSCKKLRENALWTYKHIESLPETTASIF